MPDVYRPEFFQTLEDPEVTKAKARVAEKIKPLIDAADRLISILQEEIEAMPVASRFSSSPSTSPEVSRLNLHTTGILEREGEAGLKRAQLRSELGQVMGEYVRLVGKLKDLGMNIEATKTEG